MKNLLKTVALALLVTIGFLANAQNTSYKINKQKRVLLVMSSYDDLGISGKQSGTWFTELAAPYYILTEAGYEVVLASPDGGDAPVDLLSMKVPFTTQYTDKFLKDPVALFAAKHTRKLRNESYTHKLCLFPIDLLIENMFRN